MRLVFIDLEGERPDLGAHHVVFLAFPAFLLAGVLMASIRVVLATKTSALNAVYFIFAKTHWFAGIGPPLRAGIGTRSWLFCGSEAN
jgi:exosortase/archaeosortase